MKEPDRKRGGTFIRDENGKLLQHIPPTRVDLGPQPKPNATAAAESIKPAAKPAAETARGSRGSKE